MKREYLFEPVTGKCCSTAKTTKYHGREKVGMWEKWLFYMKSLEGRRSLSFFMTEFPEKRRERGGSKRFISTRSQGHPT